MLDDQRKHGWTVKRCGTFKRLGAAAVLQLPKQQTAVIDRLVDASVTIKNAATQDISFQHSILCQTSLPYRDPGDDVRLWERLNGTTHMEIIAGKAMHPEAGRLVPLGLPFGPKPRLVLAHINTEALRTGSPEIEVEDSLTAFVKRLGFASHGRNMRTVKEQLARLSAATIRLGVISESNQALTVNAQIVSAFNLWFPKDDRQRVLWPSTVRLSLDYFESLKKHAVPLDERALAALSHSAMGLDIYAWLAQRLYRIRDGKRTLVPWPVLKEQFGADYARLRKFREVFMTALNQVHAVYPAMKIDVTRHGLFLYPSPPPVAKNAVVVKLPY